MKYLLDVNTLIALAHTSHGHHARALAWFHSVQENAQALCTCAITELGFVRVAVQTNLQMDVPTARKALAGLKASSPIPFEMLADALGGDRLPAFARIPAKLTDGHLIELAKQHAAQLATLDTGIPGSMVLP
jgi:predicted nucleic acid-binding protein